MMAKDLSRWEDWTGDVNALARAAGEILSARGLESSEPNVRVIRDYAQRGIVSRGERQGKEAIYGVRQLLELVAARVLVADGWPLAKIAEHFAHIGEAELRQLIGEGTHPALALVQRLREQTPGDMGRAAQVSTQHLELRATLRRLGLPEEPQIDVLTRIVVAPGCQLLIDPERLSRLTVEEAQALGQAITMALLKSRRKKT